MRPADKLSQFFVVEHMPNINKHEDSFCYDFLSSDIHLSAVFDGCGGLGSRHYSKLADRTGAFIAAQSCAKIVEQWYRQLTPEMLADQQHLMKTIHSMIVKRLTDIENKYADQNRLLGSMVRTMPCTASVVLVHSGITEESLSVTALNAGDSRIYILTAEHGLQQLTHDDLRGDPDALMNLYVSAPLSNVVNIDSEFSFHVRTVDFSSPFAVLTASDGIFGYVRTPMDFENLLLQSMVKAATFEEFESAFRQSVSEISGDDATAIMAFYGWNNFSAIKRSFGRRSAYVADICAQLGGEPSDDAIENAWLKYKPEAYM